MYFLDLNEAIEEHLAHPLNHRISCNLMTLLEEMLQDTKNYSKDYKKMSEVEDDANQLAASLGQKTNRQLIFTVLDGVE